MGKLRENLLTIMTLVGVAAGLGLGLGLKALRSEEPWTQREANYVGYPGKIFLNMLKCMIIPLIVPSLIAAIGQLDLRTSGIQIISNLISSAVTLPGIGSVEETAKNVNSNNSTTVDTLLDLFTNCFPPNLVQATLQQYKTQIIYPGNDLREDPKTGAMLDPADLLTWEMSSSWSNSTNILGLVVFSIATGIAISISGEEGKPLLKFFQSVSHVMMKLTSWIVCLAPVGVAFLIAGEILHMKSVLEELVKLGWYLFVVCLGISLQGGVVLPLIYSIITRSLPFKFMGNMGPALATAFGTASSSATLPVTINNLENGNKINPVIARFVLPIGATINMDGTALYEAVAAIFIAQLTGMNPTLGQIIIISITATAASIGAAGIPHAGLVTLVMVLETVGLPSEYVSIIMSVDWLVDRFRTLVNVLGDSFGAAIVAHLCKDDFNQTEDDNELKPLEHKVEYGGGDELEASKLIQSESLHLPILLNSPEKPKEADKFAYHTSRDRSKCVDM